MANRRLFISQPMRDMTKEEILEDRQKYLEDAIQRAGEPLDLIDTFFDDDLSKKKKYKKLTKLLTVGNEPEIRLLPIFYLVKSIELLATADYAYFAPEWSNYRGCIVEHSVAREYGISILRD